MLGFFLHWTKLISWCLCKIWHVFRSSQAWYASEWLVLNFIHQNWCAIKLIKKRCCLLKFISRRQSNQWRISRGEQASSVFRKTVKHNYLRTTYQFSNWQHGRWVCLIESTVRRCGIWEISISSSVSALRTWRLVTLKDKFLEGRPSAW